MINCGIRHGKGTLYYIDGGLYEVDWINDMREGKGVMYYSNGKYIREGIRSFYFYTGGSYEGEFKNNIILLVEMENLYLEMLIRSL